MKILFISALTLLVSLVAGAVTMDCAGIQNTQTVYTQRINLGSRAEVVLPKLGYLTAKVKSLGPNQYEIEVFNPAIPARSYSTGVMKMTGDFLKWSNWDREAIFEIACIQRQ